MRDFLAQFDRTRDRGYTYRAMRKSMRTSLALVLAFLVWIPQGYTLAPPASVPSKETELEKWISAFKLPDDTAEYIRHIYRKYLQEPTSYVIGGNFIPSAMLTEERFNFIPSAMLTEEERENYLGVIDYNSLLQEEPAEHYSASAKEVDIVMNPLDGGFGGAVVRQRYLNQRAREEKEINTRVDPRSGKVRSGAKGTDLAFRVNRYGKEYKVSVAEIKLLRLLKEHGSYRRITYQPLISGESQPSYEALLRKPYLFISNETYEEALKEKKIIIGDMERFKARQLPTINPKTGKLQGEPSASGGHGEHGMKFLLEALRTDVSKLNKTFIRAFFNGDGVNNAPKPLIVGWMKKRNVPIVMITTTKTGIDRKGGLIGVEILPNGKRIAQILELAQVNKNLPEQLRLFEEMGLTIGAPHQQFFNTNIALLNYSVLSPILQELAVIIGEERVKEIITPTLIPNSRETPDGIPFIQFDSALASALLNLNAFFESADDHRIKEILTRRGLKRLVQIVNVDEAHRTEFFTPIKNSFDFWLQAYGGFYQLDAESWVLRDTHQGQIPPIIELAGSDEKDPYYQEVQNLIESFGGFESVTSIRDLDALEIRGRVDIRNIRLRGQVRISSEYPGIFDLSEYLAIKGARVSDEYAVWLQDVYIQIDREGRVYNIPLNHLASLLQRSGATREKAYEASAKFFALKTRLSGTFLNVLGPKGNVIRNMDSSLVYEAGLLHMTSIAVMVDPDGNWVLLKNGPTEQFPRRWTLPAADAGSYEGYRDAIEKELKRQLDVEELRGHLALIGEEGGLSYFGLHNERRSIYVYFLAPQENRQLHERAKVLHDKWLEFREDDKFEAWLKTESTKDKRAADIMGVDWSTEEDITGVKNTLMLRVAFKFSPAVFNEVWKNEWVRQLIREEVNRHLGRMEEKAESELLMQL